MNFARPYQQADAFHRQGDLAQAERLYRQILEADPDDFAVCHAMGVLCLQQGRSAEALEWLSAALRTDPNSVKALADCGLVLHLLGRLEEALAHFDRALTIAPGLEAVWLNRGVTLNALNRPAEALASFDRAPALQLELDALHNRGDALWALGRLEESLACYELGLRSAPGDALLLNSRGITLFGLKRYDEALASYDRALAARPDYAEALNNRGNVFLELHCYGEALENYRKALAVDPASAGAWKNYGRTLLETGAVEESLAASRRCADLGYEAPRPGEICLPHKTRHDKERQGYLESLAGGDGDFGARLPTAAVNETNRAGVTERWRQSNRQLVVIDDFLSAAALQSLRQFCLSADIWRDVHAGGYIGAFPEHGFACPLLAQISEEMRRGFPAIFGSHHLHGLWAFKYDSSLNGIDVHADEAAVNVNFWITPDEANLDPESGGLVVWDTAAPLDWDFSHYNCDAEAARAFLAGQGAKSVTVPYRSNRAVIFDSNLFHNTDRIAFKPGYVNRRINVTLLYGKRQTAVG